MTYNRRASAVDRGRPGESLECCDETGKTGADVVHFGDVGRVEQVNGESDGSSDDGDGPEDLGGETQSFDGVKRVDENVCGRWSVPARCR